MKVNSPISSVSGGEPNDHEHRRQARIKIPKSPNQSGHPNSALKSYSCLICFMGASLMSLRES